MAFQIDIARPGAGGGNTLRGVIKRASFLGAMMDYLVEIDGAHLRTELPTHTAIAENLVFKDGEECAISFHNLHWFDARHMAEVTA